MRNFVIIFLLFGTLFPGDRLRSLILPGWGEISKGHISKGKVFLYSEALLWVSLIGSSKASDWYYSDQRAFAAQHAGIDIALKDAIYGIHIGQYNDIVEYNDVKERQRSKPMEIDLNGHVIREYGHEIYPESQGYDWSWDTSDNRQFYNKLRVTSGIYNQYKRFAIAGLILNRFISLIDVLYIERTSGNKMESNLYPTNDGLVWNLSIKL